MVRGNCSVPFGISLLLSSDPAFLGWPMTCTIHPGRDPHKPGPARSRPRSRRRPWKRQRSFWSFFAKGYEHRHDAIELLLTGPMRCVLDDVEATAHVEDRRAVNRSTTPLASTRKSIATAYTSSFSWSNGIAASGREGDRDRDRVRAGVSRSGFRSSVSWVRAVVRTSRGPSGRGGNGTRSRPMKTTQYALCL